jgi:hypothetical protein
LRDIKVQQSSGGNISTSLTTTETKVISDLSINPTLTVSDITTSYTTTFTTVNNLGGYPTYTMSGDYIAYLSPTASIAASYTGYALDSAYQSYTTTGRFYNPVRYNAIFDKGLFCYAEYGSGFGMGIVKNGVVTKTKFVDTANNLQPIFTQYFCNVQATKDSPVVTVISGQVPPIGTSVASYNFTGNPIVLSIDGNILTLSRSAQNTTNINGAALIWGFPAPQYNVSRYLLNWNAFTATGRQCDIQDLGMTMLNIADITYATNKLPNILKNDVRIPVQFYNDDFSYQSTQKYKVYKPGKVKKSATGTAVFKIYAASFHP